MSEPVATKEAGPPPGDSPPHTITEEKKSTDNASPSAGVKDEKKQRQYKEFGGEEQEVVRKFVSYMSFPIVLCATDLAFAIAGFWTVHPSRRFPRLLCGCRWRFIDPSLHSCFVTLYTMLTLVFVPCL